jgi:hypothetical protein
MSSPNLIFKIGNGSEEANVIDFNTINPEDVSFYTIEFVLKVLSTKMTAALNADPNVIYNPYFQQALKTLQKAKFEIENAENSTDQKYVCHTPDNLGNIDISNYQPGGHQPCSDPAIVKDLLLPTVQAWNIYLENPSVSNNDKQSVNFDVVASKIATEVRTGDYFSNYSQINSLWKTSLEMLQNLATASVTEKQIIDNGVNVDVYFVDLKFESHDIDPALILSTDMVDLVSYGDLNKSLKSGPNASHLYAQIQSEGNIMGSTSFCFSAERDCNSQQRGSTSFKGDTTAKMLADLTAKTAALPDISPISNGLRILTQTKIYKDKNGIPVAPLEDAQKSAERIADLQLAQSAFLDRLDRLPNSRGQTYSRTYTISQSGGRLVDLDSFEGQTDSKQTIDVLNMQVAELLKEFYTKQELYYEDPKSPISTRAIVRKNDHFMELLRLLSAESKPLKDSADKFSENSSELSTYVSQYKKIIASYLYKLNIASESDLIAIKSELLSDIKNLRPESSLDSIFEKKTLSENAMADLSNLDFNTADAASVANALEQLMLTSDSIQTTKKIPDLIVDLKNTDRLLTRISDRLEADYSKLSVRSDQIEMIRKTIGTNLKGDLSLGNILIEDLIFVNRVNDFNLKSLDTIKTESRKSQRRLQDLETYMQGIKAEVQTKQFTDKEARMLIPSVSQPQNSDVSTVFDVSGDIDLEEFHKNMVENYFNNTLANIDNLSTYSALSKRRDTLVDEADFLTWNKIAFNIAEPLGNVSDVATANRNLSKSMYLMFPENGLVIGSQINWLIDNYVIFDIGRIDRLYQSIFVPGNSFYLHGDLSKENAANWLLSMIEHNNRLSNRSLDTNISNLTLDEKITFLQTLLASENKISQKEVDIDADTLYPNWKIAYANLQKQLRDARTTRKTNYETNVLVFSRSDKSDTGRRLTDKEIQNNFSEQINLLNEQIDETTSVDVKAGAFELYANNLELSSKACLIIALTPNVQTRLLLEQLGTKISSLVRLCDIFEYFGQESYIADLISSAAGYEQIGLQKNLITKFIEDVRVALISEQFQPLVEQLNSEKIYSELVNEGYVEANIDDATSSNIDPKRAILLETYDKVYGKGIAFAKTLEKEIYGLIEKSGIFMLSLLREQLHYYFSTYRQTSKLFNLFDSEAKIDAALEIKTTERDRTRITLVKGSYYAANRDAYNEIIRKIGSITTYVDESLGKAYDFELDIVLEIEKVNQTIKAALAYGEKWTGFRTSLVRRNLELMTSLVFNPQMNQQYLSNSELNTILITALTNNSTIADMMKVKLAEITNLNNHQILYNDQINNYLASKMIMGRTLEGKSPIAKYYKQMSFGIVEYYYDIMDSILNCLDGLSEPFEETNEVGRYLYRYHYITLRRCYALFRYLIVNYLTEKKVENPTIIKYKILTAKTASTALEVFTEFHLLRRYLDEFSATMMDKVQLHLRINDFVSSSYNTITKTKYPDAEFLLDVDPYGETYAKRWDNGDLIFTNRNNGNKLDISFDLLERIQIRTARKPKPFNAYYQKTYSKMESHKGIDFKRIYNTTVFPNADVIASYMSIAPNIVANQGTVIMTYGYSGVGKSASLFGVKSSSPNIPASNGILQATLDQFDKAQIYFRVYEIYGLGTQYNYYWNPTSQSSGGLDCYPNFSQMIIQHELITTGSVLGLTGKKLLQNRSDMFNYVMELRNPKSSRSYKRISESHYRNFTDFVGKIDATREQGIEIRKAFTHLITQVKSTINNPISSRSILVYDFEVNIDPNNDICVPFLIYDLPGNEDILQTYVTPNLESVLDNTVRSRIFADIIGDGPNKERKSAYVMNPILTPIFDDNLQTMKAVLAEIQSDQSYNNLIQDFLNYVVVNYNLDIPNDSYRPNGTSFRIADLFKIQPYSLADILSAKNLFASAEILDQIRQLNRWPTYAAYLNSDKPAERPVAENFARAIYLLDVLGVIGVQRWTNPVALTDEIVQKEIFILVSIVLIGFLIKYQHIDILVEILWRINGSPNSDDSGNWTRNKIYAFFEAYYINENVMGLLQYLTKNVLPPSDRSSDEIGIQSGASNNDFTTISDELNRGVQTGNRYRSLRNNAEFKPNQIAINDFGYAVDEVYIAPTPEILKQDAIDTYKLDNAVKENGSFFQYNTIQYGELFRRMTNTIAFTNRGLYDKNKVFRSGTISCSQSLANPRSVIDGSPDTLPETNRPLLQDFIEPYEQKISFYYVFYVVSNGQTINKAEEQIALLENSMSFVNRLSYSSTSNLCKAPDFYASAQPKQETFGTPVQVPKQNEPIVPLVPSIESAIINPQLIMDFTGLAPIANQVLSGGVYVRESNDSKSFLKTTSAEFLPYVSTFLEVGKNCIESYSQNYISQPDILYPSVSTAKFLPNLGNSCYFGSGLQLIYKMESVRNYINRAEFGTSKLSNIQNVMRYMSGEPDTTYDQADYLEGRQLMVCDNLESMRDAGEFINSVLSNLPADIQNAYNWKISNNFLAADKTILTSKTDNVYPWIIGASALNKKSKNILFEALDKSFSPEIVGGSNALQDSTTKDYVFTVKCQKPESAPDYLFIQISIFEPTKIKINYDIALNMKFGLSVGGRGYLYTLVGIITHIGENHYASTVFNGFKGDDLIYSIYDDQTSEKLDILQSKSAEFLSPKAIKGTPYILLYERIKTPLEVL